MIEIKGLDFQYGEGDFHLDVPELSIARGEKVAFIGPSGSGKTTLIYLIAGVLQANKGSIRVDDIELSELPDKRRRVFRISQIGFVFQEFELIEYLSVRDNILLPYHLNPALTVSPDVPETVESLAVSMKLADKLKRFPKTLSQGEKQRVAICRALVAAPDLLIADEPTGNLDPATAGSILELLLETVELRRSTLLMVTHNHGLLKSFDRVIDVMDFASGRAP
ncbi:MAG: ATP-binding cassette domain-containing protein [Phycisphaerales bacterium]|nr:ATP-binding cassette domain-containing protein [Phycisphaerales bacterium]